MSALGSAKAARDTLSASFTAAGVRPGGVLLVHSSLRACGPVPGGADTVIDALLDAIGPEGTLVIPTLSYLFTTREEPRFDVRTTPTNLGAIPAAALRRSGALRSLHPTHSCAALGPRAAAVTGSHDRDDTPVGPNSPFAHVRSLGGQVAFLGCGTRCNTSVHGVEEQCDPLPAFLFEPAPCAYELVDGDGRETTTVHRRHGFAGVAQRYERVEALLPPGALTRGPIWVSRAAPTSASSSEVSAGAGAGAGADVALFHKDEATSATSANAGGGGCGGSGGGGEMVVMDARAMWAAAAAALAADPGALTEALEGSEEAHCLVQGSCGAFRYRVVPVNV